MSLSPSYKVIGSKYTTQSHFYESKCAALDCQIETLVCSFHKLTSEEIVIEDDEQAALEFITGPDFR